MTRRDRENDYMAAKLNTFFVEHGELNMATMGDFQTMFMNDPVLAVLVSNYATTAQMNNLPEDLTA